MTIIRYHTANPTKPFSYIFHRMRNASPSTRNHHMKITPEDNL